MRKFALAILIVTAAAWSLPATANLGCPGTVCDKF
jgi:hypothetical protein